jgi:NAD(P)-dependent dehydrogenase (short-subunit alcohol dehydrogenase family)
MNKSKEEYGNPVQATLKGIIDRFKKRERVGRLGRDERLDGKKILIDGASSGLGLAAAVELAKLGGTVIMAVRSRYPEVAEVVRQRSGSGKVFIHQVDFSDFDSIRNLVEEVKAQHGKLDVVICNAALVASKSVRTRSGLEQMFMVNYLSRYYYISLLLKNGCFNTQSREKPRIIFVASESHRNAGEFDWKGFGAYMPFRMGKAVEWYGYTKLLLLTFARELSRSLNRDETGFSVFALCPGPVNSNIAREAPRMVKPLLRLVFALFFSSPEKACEPVIYHAASTRQEGKPFDYLFLMERKAIDEKAEDPANGEMLRQLSEELLRKVQVVI